MKKLLLFCGLTGMLALPPSVGCAEHDAPAADKRLYSPYARRVIPRRVFFGDTRLQTA